MPNESYVSLELTRKLRMQQGGLRAALGNLERRLAAASTTPIAEQVAGDVRILAQLYRAHDALVLALLEAVEPDQPATHPFAEDQEP